MGSFFPRKILFFSGALVLGLTCLCLEPTLATTWYSTIASPEVRLKKCVLLAQIHNRTRAAPADEPADGPHLYRKMVKVNF